jgi:hypothetical protein
MKKKYLPLLWMALFLLCSFANAQALEFVDGRIKLVIDEKLGRFSLYHMTDVERKTWSPLFWDKDKRTSFLSVLVGSREYKLGETSSFKVVMRGTDKKPVLAFESPFLSVTEEFSFIRTASSGVSDGVRIDIRVENWSEEKTTVGARLLIDTFLGEKTNPNFRTDLRPIDSELVINKTTNDQYWVSHNDKYGMMGSIFVEGIDAPDYVQFANWKRLNDARFTAEYVSTRSFNAMPFSAKDSAVCYYLEPKPMERWEQRAMTVLLAAEDQYGFDVSKVKAIPSFEFYHQAAAEEKTIERHIAETGAARENLQGQLASNLAASNPNTSSQAQAINIPGGAAAAPAPATGKRQTTMMLPIGPMRVDLMTLRELIYKVDEYIYSGNTITEEELKGMELTITKLKSRYGAVFNSY